MAKLPSFQFYPGDWLKDAALRRCSLGARGLWIDMLCLMFDTDERGVLITGGTPWTIADVRRAAGCSAYQCQIFFKELKKKGVVAQRSDGAFFSRRMMRDERLRAVRAESGRKRWEQKRSKSEANSLQIPEDEEEEEEKESRKRESGADSDSLHDWLAARWFPSGVAESDFSRLFGLVSDLTAKRATTAQCETVCERFESKWPNATLTPEAMVKHWDTFLREPVAARTVTPGVNRQEDVERKRIFDALRWSRELDDDERERIRSAVAAHVAKKHDESRAREIMADSEQAALAMWCYAVHELR